MGIDVMILLNKDELKGIDDEEQKRRLGNYLVEFYINYAGRWGHLVQQIPTDYPTQHSNMREIDPNEWRVLNKYNRDMPYIVLFQKSEFDTYYKVMPDTEEYNEDKWIPFGMLYWNNIHKVLDGS